MFFDTLFDIDSNFNSISLSGLTDDLSMVYVNSLFNRCNQDIIIVTSTLYEANKLYDILKVYNSNVFLFPMDEFLTSEALAVSPEFKLERLSFLNKSSNDKKIVITHLMGYLRYLPSKELWNDSIITLKKGMTVNRDNLVEKLLSIGYVRDVLVTNTSSIAVRGFVLDIFPLDFDKPIRIEFFGDEIEQIKYFNVDNQLTLEELDSVNIVPCSEFINELGIEIESKQKYLPKVVKNLSSIVDYLNSPITIFRDYNQIEVSYNNLLEDIHNYDLEQNERLYDKYMHDLYSIKYNKVIYLLAIDNVFVNYPVDKNIAYNSYEVIPYNNNLEKLKLDCSSYLDEGKTIVLGLKNNRQYEKMESIINDMVLTNSNEIFPNKINVIYENISHGFVFNNYVVISESEIFALSSKKVSYKRSYKNSSKIKSLEKLEIGDAVVHDIHGIGIYTGLKTLDKNGIQKDYLTVEYKDGDKLYIPVEKIELISKYSSAEGVRPKLNKLGGTEWAKTKLRVRSKLHDIADKLLKLYAMREMQDGYAFPKDTPEQEIFESEFLYTPTSDQLVATSQIKEDMEKKTPMDRLLCGDVGFGKTEVAFRAIFKAIMAGKQVAYLCPTKILSQQHYKSALMRFSNYPIDIALLNGFISTKMLNKTLDGLKKGTIDLVIGTHRLLSDDIEFKDLGLLIIDEEQRFGVAHKEKIKEMKSNVDVLTLSATPIPRTMQMSMVGLRNLSLIETPPVDRYPVQTYVLSYSTQIIKDAIYKELSRNGQIFILYNRVMDIETRVREISKIAPDARITYAHGKMTKNELESRMESFINQEYDILVCTTIIETGIDIPNVNTLIIIDADHFGLSQLYQIRGRVGRSNKIAYAYLMYDNKKVLTEQAVKRLKVIKDFTELGSGMSIAVRDLSIRGAGDILGSEQAGFIDTIGIELYLKMLNAEVEKLKGNIIEDEDISEKPLVDVDTHIDNSYVTEEELKIEIHKKINEIDSYYKLLEVRSELEDRFGTVTEEMDIYMYEEWFEKLCINLKINRIKQTRNSVEIEIHNDIVDKLGGDKLFFITTDISKMFRFKNEFGKVILVLDTVKLEKHFIYYLVEFLEKIKKELDK